MQTRFIKWREPAGATLKAAAAGDFCPREANSEDTKNQTISLTSSTSSSEQISSAYAAQIQAQRYDATATMIGGLSVITDYLATQVGGEWRQRSRQGDIEDNVFVVLLCCRYLSAQHLKEIAQHVLVAQHHLSVTFHRPYMQLDTLHLTDSLLDQDSVVVAVVTSHLAKWFYVVIVYQLTNAAGIIHRLVF